MTQQAFTVPGTVRTVWRALAASIVLAASLLTGGAPPSDAAVVPFAATLEIDFSQAGGTKGTYTGSGTATVNGASTTITPITRLSITSLVTLGGGPSTIRTHGPVPASNFPTTPRISVLGGAPVIGPLLVSDTGAGLQGTSPGLTPLRMLGFASGFQDIDLVIGAGGYAYATRTAPGSGGPNLYAQKIYGDYWQTGNVLVNHLHSGPWPGGLFNGTSVFAGGQGGGTLSLVSPMQVVNQADIFGFGFSRIVEPGVARLTLTLNPSTTTTTSTLPPSCAASAATWPTCGGPCPNPGEYCTSTCTNPDPPTVPCEEVRCECVPGPACGEGTPPTCGGACPPGFQCFDTTPGGGFSACVCAQVNPPNPSHPSLTGTWQLTVSTTDPGGGTPIHTIGLKSIVQHPDQHLTISPHPLCGTSAFGTSISRVTTCATNPSQEGIVYTTDASDTIIRWPILGCSFTPSTFDPPVPSDAACPGSALASVEAPFNAVFRTYFQDGDTDVFASNPSEPPISQQCPGFTFDILCADGSSSTVSTDVVGNAHSFQLRRAEVQTGTGPITVRPFPGGSVTFEGEVTASGAIALGALTFPDAAVDESNQVVPQAGGLVLFYDVVTDAAFTGTALTCVPYVESAPGWVGTVEEQDLKLYHEEAGLFVDRTATTGLGGGPNPDTVSNVICARTDSFSQFAPIATAPTEVPIAGTKLVVVDKQAAAGRAKVVFVSKDSAITKGAGVETGSIATVLQIAYEGADGGFYVSSGESDGAAGWTVNKATVAKYVNKGAPDGPTEAKVTVVKPGKVIKLVGKGLGDAAFDVLGAGAPAGDVRVTYVVNNDTERFAHCTTFSDCVYKPIAAGTGAKLVCKNGAATACDGG